MKLIQYLAALNAAALSATAGSVDSGQCNGLSALGWISPSICTDTEKCSESRIQESALDYEMHDVEFDNDPEGDDVKSTIGNAQCNGRPPLWIRPSLCTDTATDLTKCSDSKILSAPDYEVYDNALAQDDEMMRSTLTNFMTWAAVTRDVEMQREDQELCEDTLTNFMTWAAVTRDVEMQREGQELCEDSNSAMPWEMQVCAGDIKLVHRTQPMLGHGDYNFDPEVNPAMAGKEPDTSAKSGFGLPREKVRKFMSMLKPLPAHLRKIPVESYA